MSKNISFNKAEASNVKLLIMNILTDNYLTKYSFRTGVPNTTHTVTL